MTHNNDQPRTEPRCGELNTSHLRGCNNVPCDTDNKEVSKPLVEDKLRRNAGVGASEHNRERLLTNDERGTSRGTQRKRRA